MARLRAAPVTTRRCIEAHRVASSFHPRSDKAKGPKAETGVKPARPLLKGAKTENGAHVVALAPLLLVQAAQAGRPFGSPAAANILKAALRLFLRARSDAVRPVLVFAWMLAPAASSAAMVGLDAACCVIRRMAGGHSD